MSAKCPIAAIAPDNPPMAAGDPTRAHVGVELTARQFSELKTWARRSDTDLSSAVARMIDHSLRTLAPRQGRALSEEPS